MPQQKAEILIEAKDSATRSLQELKSGLTGVTNTQGHVNGLASSFGNLGGMIRQAVSFAAGLTLFYSLRSAIQSVLEPMIMTAARTETLGVAMDAVAKATGTSIPILREQEEILKKQGITTQEARGILTLFMQSQLDVADASKIARVAQDLAVISGENSSEAARTLTNAIASQEPMLLRNYGIVKNLPDIYEEYGKQLGLVTEETDKNGKVSKAWSRELTEVEKKQAFMNTILEQGAKVSGVYETAMDKVGKKMTSLPRYFEEAANTIGEVFLPALNIGVDALTNFLKAIPTTYKSTLDKIKPVITAFVNDVKQNVTTAFNWLKDEWDKIKDLPLEKKISVLISDLKDAFSIWWTENEGVVKEYGDKIGETLGAGIAQIPQYIKAVLSGDDKAIGEAGATVGGRFAKGFAEGFGKNMKGLDLVGFIGGAIGGGVIGGPKGTAIGAAIGPAILDAFKSYWTREWPKTLNEMFSGDPEQMKQGLADMIGLVFGGTLFHDTVAGAVKPAVDSISTWISNAINGVVAWFAGLPMRIVTGLTGFVNTVRTWFMNAANTARSSASNLVNTAIYALSQLPNRAAFILGQFVGGVVRGFLQAAVSVAGIVPQIPSIVASALTSMWSIGVSIIDSFVGSVSGLFSSLIGNVASLIYSLPGIVASGLSSMWSAGISIVSSFVSTFASVLSGVVGAVWSILSHVVDVVFSFGGDLYNAASEMANNFWQGFLDALGIHSPSYVERAFFAMADASKLAVDEIKGNLRSIEDITPRTILTEQVMNITGGIQMPKQNDTPQVIQIFIDSDKVLEKQLTTSDMYRRLGLS